MIENRVGMWEFYYLSTIRVEDSQMQPFELNGSLVVCSVKVYGVEVDYWMLNQAREGCQVLDPIARFLSNYGDSGK